MNYSVQTRNMTTVPSVRRRVFGPYKPCPRAKRVLMEKQDTEITVNTHEQNVPNNELDGDDVGSGVEENIDFAVESSKVENTPPVIELDTEDESEEVVNNVNTVNDIDIVPAEELPNQSQPSVSDESVTDELPDPSGNQVSNEIEVTEDIPDQTENHVSDEISVPSNVLSTVTPSTPPCVVNGNAKCDIKKAKAFKLINEFSPKVVVERTPPKIFSSFNSNKIFPKQYKTYMSQNHELRFFKIVLKDCCPRKKSCEEATVKTYKMRESKTVSKTPLQLSPKRSKVARIGSANNVIKRITCDVSKAEFIDNYESAIAKKLEVLKQNRQEITPSQPHAPESAQETPRPALNKLNRTVESPKQPSFVPTKTNLSLNLPVDNSVSLINISESATEVKHPVHPRTRLRLSPIKKPSRQVNMLNYAISKSQQKNYVELSDSDTESQSSVITSSEVGEINVEMKNEEGEDESVLSNDDDILTVTADESENLNNIYIKPEIKNETMEEPSSYYIESDEEVSACLLDAYKTVKRRRRKVSSNKKVESVIAHVTDQSQAKPTLIRLSPVVKSSRDFPTTFTHQYSSSSLETSSIYDHSLPADDFKSDIQINLVKLPNKTVENLIKLCKNSTSWDDNSLLEKAGMSWYDIHRLGTVSRSRQISSYGLRQFVKKNRKLFEGGSIEKPRPPSVLKGMKKADRKALKHKLKMKEKKRQDEESVRRALLRINARLLNQNRFWAFINRGSSQDHPIVL